MDGYTDDRLARFLLECRKLGQMLQTDPRLNLARKGSNIATVCGAPLCTREIGMLVISMADHKSETAYPSQRALAKRTGHGRTSVSLALDWLVDEWYLARTRGKKGRNSRYRPIFETAHGFVLGDENFWRDFLTPENSSGSAMGEHSGAAMGEHESRMDDSENSGEFFASPAAPVRGPEASADFGFPYFWSLLKRFGRLHQVRESRKSVEKKYKTALTYPDVTDEILCTGYHASLMRYHGKKNFTYPGVWLDNPENFTTGLEKGKPSAAKKSPANKRRADSLGPGATTGAPEFVMRELGFTLAAAKEALDAHGIGYDGYSDDEICRRIAAYWVRLKLPDLESAASALGNPRYSAMSDEIRSMQWWQMAKELTARKNVSVAAE